MRRFRLALPVALAIASGIACGVSSSGSGLGEESDAGDAAVTPPGTIEPTDDGPAPTGKAGTGENTGLPCDVQQVVENRCIGCHGGDQAPPMLTYADLVAKSAKDPALKVAERCLLRMRSPDAGMPPPPALPPEADEIAAFDKWVDAGTPRGKACTPPPPLDGGADAGDAGPLPTAPDGGSVCTSATLWADGNNGDREMRPGGTCITCHSMLGGPNYYVAGTVYPTLHEPNDCNGADLPRMEVVVTDATGKTVRLDTNAVGNFFSRTRLTAPLRAEVRQGGKTRVMQGAITAGDCNRCHTEKGINGAPGRVVAP